MNIKTYLIAIGIISFIALEAMTLQGYIIRNDTKSTANINVNVYTPSKTKRYLYGDIPARHWLKPGEEAAWNQNEIRKKLKREDIGINISPINEYSIVQNSLASFMVPISADLTITVAKIGTNYIGGAIDHNTGKIYNEKDYNIALQYLKNENK